MLLGLGTRDARRAWQPAQVGGEVEVVAHLDLAVVADIDRALRQPAVQRRNASAREVVGMDVVGVDVVTGRETGVARARRSRGWPPARSAA
jgi:hypothetical protein